MTKRVSISLDKEQVVLLRKIRGLGKKDAEIVKNIFLIYLYENGYLDRKKNEKIKKEK